MKPEHPAVNDGPACFSSRLKPAGYARPASDAQGPSGPLPKDRRVVYGPRPPNGGVLMRVMDLPVSWG
jgi:hypothetical protein